MKIRAITDIVVTINSWKELGRFSRRIKMRINFVWHMQQKTRHETTEAFWGSWDIHRHIPLWVVDRCLVICSHVDGVSLLMEPINSPETWCVLLSSISVWICCWKKFLETKVRSNFIRFGIKHSFLVEYLERKRDPHLTCFAHILDSLEVHSSKMPRNFEVKKNVCRSTEERQTKSFQCSYIEIVVRFA